MQKLLFVVSFTLSVFTFHSTHAEPVVGITQPVSDVVMSMSIGGVVSDLFVQEGDQVSISQPLLKLDDRAEVIEVKRRKLISDDQSLLQVAKENQVSTERLLSDNIALYEETGSISFEEVEKLKMQARELSGDIKAMEQAEIKERYEYDISALNLAQRTLTSPIKGVVTELQVEVGEWVKPGLAIIRIVDTSNCFLEVNVEESLARELRLHAQLPVQVWAGSGHIEKQAKIIFISPVADRASSLVRIKLQFDNKEKDIWPGMQASIDFSLLQSN